MTTQNSTLEPFQLSIDLSVLKHLGINLYSNVPAVLSEIVANAWDADASEVRIHWNQELETIVIKDDGVGMTREQVNRRFLTVGYRRREAQPGLTPIHKRSPMGRKGIGKLSLFSIAGEIDVETSHDGAVSAFRMRLEDIEKEIRQAEQEKRPARYRPREIGDSDYARRHGTRITLRDLRRRQTIRSPRYLKQRVARRFSIIGPEQDFNVYVNGDEVQPRDRGYYDKVQYLWTYGEHAKISQLCDQKEQHQRRPDVVNLDGLRITGWLGTVKEAKNLKDDEGDNINQVAVFVRGKVAQEDLLGDFAERGVYAGYLIGDLHVEELDQYDGEGEEDEDAATTSRQQVVEGDPRYQEIRRLIQAELRHVQLCWAEWRPKFGISEAKRVPEVGMWLDSLKPAERREAERWIGRIYRYKFNSEMTRTELLKHTILAFEIYRAKGNLQMLSEISDESWSDVLRVIGDFDTLEETLYGQIVRQRIGVIEKLEMLTEDDEIEKVIQRYLFEHLWLLDPAWERADGTEVMEKAIKTIFGDVDKSLSMEERKGRLDIQYRKTAGQHVIIELKRPGRVISLREVLSAQIGPYYDRVMEALDQHGDSDGTVDIVLVVGRLPKEWSNEGERKRALDSLKPYRARVMFYRHLLRDAKRAYADYLEKRNDRDSLRLIIDALENFAIDQQVC